MVIWKMDQKSRFYCQICPDFKILVTWLHHSKSGHKKFWKVFGFLGVQFLNAWPFEIQKYRLCEDFESCRIKGPAIMNTVGIWNPTIWNQDFLKVKFQMVRFSNGQALVMSIPIVLTIQNLDIIVRISNGFWQMAAIYPNFKWLGFRISDHIQNPDHLQPNLFLTIQNPD